MVTVGEVVWKCGYSGRGVMGGERWWCGDVVNSGRGVMGGGMEMWLQWEKSNGW